MITPRNQEIIDEFLDRARERDMVVSDPKNMIKEISPGTFLLGSGRIVHTVPGHFPLPNDHKDQELLADIFNFFFDKKERENDELIARSTQYRATLPPSAVDQQAVIQWILNGYVGHPRYEEGLSKLTDESLIYCFQHIKHYLKGKIRRECLCRGFRPEERIS